MGRCMLRQAGPAAALPCPMPLHAADPLALMCEEERPWDVRTRCDVWRMVREREEATDCGRPILCRVRDADVGRMRS